MTKLLGAMSFATLIGALICAVVLVGLGTEIGHDRALSSALGQMTIGLGFVFVLTYGVTLLLDRRATPRHRRIFDRACQKREHRLGAKQRKAFYTLTFKQSVETHGLDQGVAVMGRTRARDAVEAFRHVGLPRLARMLEDYLDALDRGDFDRMSAEEQRIYGATCRALLVRMHSAGLAKLPDILDEALK